MRITLFDLFSHCRATERSVTIIKNQFSNQISKNLLIEIIFVCIWAFLVSIHGIVDTDVFYIIPTGRYILSHGIPYTNPFITTAGLPIVIQNWAYCAAIAWVERAFGVRGLFVVMIFTIVGLYLMIRHLVSKTVQTPWVTFICTIILTYIFAYLNLRPEILTFFLIALELYGVSKYRQTNRVVFLCLLPLAMLAEINFHASYWVMHYIVLLPYLVGFPCRYVTQTCMTGTQRRHLITAAALSLPVLFINPYGIKNITYVFDALASNAFAFIQINELQPLTVNNLPYVLPILISILLFAFGLWRAAAQAGLPGQKRLTSTAVWMWGGFLVLAVTKVKWYPFFMLGLLYLFHDTGNIIESVLLKLARRVRFDKITRYVLVLCAMAVVIEYGKNAMEPLRLIIENQPLTDVFFARYPGTGNLDDWRKIREIIKRNKEPGVYSLPVGYNHFFEYEGCRVYADMRPELYTMAKNGRGSIMETIAVLNDMHRISADVTKPFFDFRKKVQKEENISEQSAFLNAEEYEALVAEIPTDYFLLANDYRGGVLSLFLNEHQEVYEKVYEGQNMTLFQKKIGEGGE